MKLRLATILLSVMIISMTGCIDKNKTQINTQNEPSPVAANPTPTQSDNMILTGMDIKNLMEKQGLYLSLAGNNDDWILNSLKPENYYFTCGPTADCKLEYGISIYTFKSQEEREKGFVDFKKQQQKNDNINIPSVWAKTNALVLYWHGTQLDQIPAYEDKVTKALTGWEKKR
ncbi:hypothetical protein [Paenibacillus sp. V4I5]|uniref:hypothetical protein n=1 Tax=Paenibacillus sp. V4I5 TaxID=3042306 RepID=UPI00278D2302|nr:hypothetical protein [Paenibacillus sp. V4I5]MDQ0917066.1 hypothetical protein [Paenibacillus sp. V4I5]